MEPVLDPNITLTSKSEEETYELAEDNCYADCVIKSLAAHTLV